MKKVKEQKYILTYFITQKEKEMKKKEKPPYRGGNYINRGMREVGL